jgi:hypothetical protein
MPAAEHPGKRHEGLYGHLPSRSRHVRSKRCERTMISKPQVSPERTDLGIWHRMMSPCWCPAHEHPVVKNLASRLVFGVHRQVVNAESKELVT